MSLHIACVLSYYVRMYICIFTSPCNEAYEFKRVRRFRERERDIIMYSNQLVHAYYGGVVYV